MDKNFPDSPTPLTVSSLMRSMLNPDYPSHIVRLLNQVKGWLTKSFRLDGLDLPYWEAIREDPDMFFGELSWLEAQAALLPAITPPAPRPEAAVLSLGEVDLTDAMRLAVDYSLIFSREVCRRVWIVSDCWIPFDVLEYSDHIKAMAEHGISLRFLVAALGKVQLPGSSSSDGGAGRNRRRRNDDD